MLPTHATLKDVMSPQPIWLRPDERLDVALALMMTCHFRHLPVLQGADLVGLVSFRDLQRVSRSRLTATRAERALHLRGIEAGAVMSRPVVAAPPDLPLEAGALRLLERRISALPIVDGGKLIGIVTRTDFLEPCALLLEHEPMPHGQPVPVRNLMTASPIATLQPDDTLDVAASILHAERVRHLPVVEDGRLVGLVADVDLLAAESTPLDRRAPAEQLLERHAHRVRDVMQTPVSTTSPDAPAADAARRLARRRIGCLPVVNHGRLVGMLTVADCVSYVLFHAPEQPARAASA